MQDTFGENFIYMVYSVVFIRFSSGFHVQVYSYYKMLCHFFVPHISPEGTTGPNWLKFGMGPPMGITRGFIEGFLEIQSGGPDMGYPRRPGGGPKILEIFFFDFFTYFNWNGFSKL